MEPLPESTFTKPHRGCANPERWHAVSGLAAEIEVQELIYGFIRALQPEVVLETGTGDGDTTDVMVSAVEANGHGHVITIELDPERARAAAERLAGRPVDVYASPSMSFDLATLHTWGQIGFAWFDADQRQRCAEVAHFAPRFAPGAVFGIHDTGPQHQTRKHFADLPPHQMLRLRTPRGVVFGQLR